MKRLLAILLILSILCIFSACGENANTGNNGDWVWALDYREGALSEQCYYHLKGRGFLYCSDISNGECIILCSNVGCDHEDPETCDGFLARRADGEMFFWDDHLYYFADDGYGMYLYRRSATGTQEVKIAAIGEKYIKEKKTISAGKPILFQGYLYYMLSVSDSVFSEKLGMQTSLRVAESICRMDLDTGMEEVLYEEQIEFQNESVRLFAAGKEGVLFSHLAGLDMETSEPDYLEKSLQRSHSLMKWNEETRDVSTVFQKNVETCVGINMLYDGKVYYRVRKVVDGKSLMYPTYSYDLATGKDELVCEVNLWHIGGGYAVCYYTDKSVGLFDLQAKKELPYILEDPAQSATTLLAMTEKGCVINWPGRLKKENEEDRFGYTPLYTAYISYSSLENGLQQDDVVILDTHEAYTEDAGV